MAELREVTLSTLLIQRLLLLRDSLFSDGRNIRNVPFPVTKRTVATNQNPPRKQPWGGGRVAVDLFAGKEPNPGPYTH